MYVYEGARRRRPPRAPFLGRVWLPTMHGGGSAPECPQVRELLELVSLGNGGGCNEGKPGAPREAGSGGQGMGSGDSLPGLNSNPGGCVTGTVSPASCP